MERDFGEEFCDDGVGSMAIDAGVVIEHDAVAEDGGGDGFEVFEGGHVISTEGSAGFCSEDEVLDGARASSPADCVFDPLRGFRLAGAGFADDFHCVIVKVIRDRDTTDELLEGDDLFSVDEF